MNNEHPFIFDQGIWLGEGRITFDVLDGKMLKYYVRWTFTGDGNVVSSLQEVEISGGGDIVKNAIVFNRGNDGFTVTFENDILGIISGHGVADERSIRWTFSDNPAEVEGAEEYVLQNDGSYTMQAHYRSPGNMSSTITGKLWKKSER